MEPVTWGWLIAAGVLALLELLVPGLVVIFLGCGAAIVALARHMGWVQGFMQEWTLFFVSSLVLVLGLRGLLQELLPGDRERADSDVDEDAVGSEVEVVQACVAGRPGEVRFRGVRWAARCANADLHVGDRATLVARDNLTWLVAPAINMPESEPS